MFEAKFTTDIKYFKSYMRELQAKTTNFKPPFTAFGEFLVKDTKQQIQSEKSPEGVPWLPLAPSTLRQKKTSLKLRETFRMVKAIFYIASKGQLEFGIKDKKYVFHHYGSKNMPARVIVGVNTTTRRKRLTKEITLYLRHIQIRRRK